MRISSPVNAYYSRVVGQSDTELSRVSSRVTYEYYIIKKKWKCGRVALEKGMISLPYRLTSLLLNGRNHGTSNE